MYCANSKHWDDRDLMVTLSLMVPQVIWKFGRLLGVWAVHPGQRVCNAVRRPIATTTRSTSTRISPQMLHVQQMPLTAGTWWPILHASRQPGVWAGLAQTTEELRSDAHSPQRQSWKTSSEPWLKRCQFWCRLVKFLFIYKYIHICLPYLIQKTNNSNYDLLY